MSPMTWGIESHVTERFGKAGVPADRIAFTRDTFTFRTAQAPSEFVSAFKRLYGPTMNAFDAATQAGRADQLERELVELFAKENRSMVAGRTEIPATYLRVTVRV